MRTAIQRMLLRPDRVIYQDTARHKEDKAYTYRYTAEERGDILAFTWWVYCMSPEAARGWLRAAITLMSALYLYSSTTMSNLTGVPASTVTKCMVTIPGAPSSRPVGSCLPSTIHALLAASAEGTTAYREQVRQLALRKAAPAALLERLSGVPKNIQKRPERGIEFFPEECDMAIGTVCSPEQADLYWRTYRRDRYQPNPGDQGPTRTALHLSALRGLDQVQTPVSGEGELPPHAAIPGCPTDHRPLQPYLRKRWCARYNLPPAFIQRPRVT
jgi:hypothetical protein